MIVQRVRAWFEIARISNLPTVVSNGLAGAGLALAASADPLADGAPRTIGFPHAWSICAPVAAYVGGMVLNDAFDARIDARERPSRPIPSGRIARSHAFVAGFALIALSIAAAVKSQSQAAVALTALLACAIVAYNAVHARSKASVLLLALCRALACVVPMLAFASDPDGDSIGASPWRVLARSGAFVLPALLALWTLGLSIAARGEVASAQSAQPAPSRRTALHATLVALAPFAALLALALFTTAGAGADQGSQRIIRMLAIAAIIAVLAAFVRVRMAWDPRSTPAAVGTWIACLALVDAMALAAVGQNGLAMVSVVLAFLTRRLQRSIAGS